MSTHLHVWRIPAGRVWELLSLARGWSQIHSTAVLIAQGAAEPPLSVCGDDSIATYHRDRYGTSDAAQARQGRFRRQIEQLTVELQLFPYEGDVLVRVLASPFGLGTLPVTAILDALPWAQEIHYSTSTDVADEDMPGKAIADAVTQMIESGSWVTAQTFSVENLIWELDRSALPARAPADRRLRPTVLRRLCGSCGGRGDDYRDGFADCPTCRHGLIDVGDQRTLAERARQFIAEHGLTDEPAA